MANGHVIIGYSFPHVATYVNTSGTISYTGCIPLARGIRVDIQPSNSDRNVLRADNADAESSGGRFSACGHHNNLHRCNEKIQQGYSCRRSRHHRSA